VASIWCSAILRKSRTLQWVFLLDAAGRQLYGNETMLVRSVNVKSLHHEGVPVAVAIAW
jgi:hypothetical protein